MNTDKNKCRVQIHAVTGRQYAAFLRKMIPLALRHATSDLRELSIVLVSDKQIARLHEQHFNDPTTTDVITFPLDLNARGKATSGELYLCVPMARRQAKQRGIKNQDELLLYAVHGILHLAGYDDLTQHAYNRMHHKEDHILQALGIGAIFSAVGPTPSSADRPADALVRSHSPASAPRIAANDGVGSTQVRRGRRTHSPGKAAR